MNSRTFSQNPRQRGKTHHHRHHHYVDELLMDGLCRKCLYRSCQHQMDTVCLAAYTHLAADRWTVYSVLTSSDRQWSEKTRLLHSRKAAVQIAKLSCCTFCARLAQNSVIVTPYAKTETETKLTAEILKEDQSRQNGRKNVFFNHTIGCFIHKNVPCLFVLLLLLGFCCCCCFVCFFVCCMLVGLFNLLILTVTVIFSCLLARQRGFLENLLVILCCMI